VVWELHSPRVAVAADRSGDVGLPDLYDVAALGAELDRLATAGLARGPEVRILTPWLGRMAADGVVLRRGRRCVVHGDLWPKNVVAVRGAAVLVDPDNIGWASPDYDLAFLARGVAAGVVTAAAADAFVAGYGAGLPDLEQAWAHARFHRLRWVLQLIRRRRWLERADRTLAGEIPLWARASGPR
jgi:Ser/Thr protein kinase RdoA (MazF antagonist)